MAAYLDGCGRLLITGVSTFVFLYFSQSQQVAEWGVTVAMLGTAEQGNREPVKEEVVVIMLIARCSLRLCFLVSA